MTVNRDEALWALTRAAAANTIDPGAAGIRDALIGIGYALLATSEPQPPQPNRPPGHLHQEAAWDGWADQ